MEKISVPGVPRSYLRKSKRIYERCYMKDVVPLRHQRKMPTVNHLPTDGKIPSSAGDL
jgi:hypothetical protein